MSADVLLRDPPEPRAPRAAPATVRVGLLGCGVVGAAVARVLLGARDALGGAAGASLELSRVAVRHVGKRRPVDLPAGAVCGDVDAIVDDPRMDVVVEVIGGLDVARRAVRRAVRNGKSVVTANKELLALHGHDLAVAAQASGVDLFFEGAAGGAIPIVSALRDRLAATPPTRIAGVLNGTTNFVLELMAETGSSRAEAVAEAQRRGYAEADPAADLDGSDAAAKLAILASLAFGRWTNARCVARDGIERIEVADLLAARALAHEIKLVAVAERNGTARVGPALVPRDSSWGRLSGVTNEVVVDCGAAGRLAFGGDGAGGEATAGAVVGDVVAAARHHLAGTRSPLPVAVAPAQLTEVRNETGLFFLRVSTDGTRGRSRRLFDALADAGVNVRRQARLRDGDGVHVAVLTGPVPRYAVEKLQGTLRVLGFGPSTLLPIEEVR